MTLAHQFVFLVDVDNTLLDNDGIQQGPKDHQVHRGSARLGPAAAADSVGNPDTQLKVTP